MKFVPQFHLSLARQEGYEKGKDETALKELKELQVAMYNTAIDEAIGAMGEKKNEVAFSDAPYEDTMRESDREIGWNAHRTEAIKRLQALKK
ncbi:MAG: hypothetical protein DDT19_01134 [Syntrophomonadaceae bacterium]|nr:hypothetical protein [Bacillota bacterium]